MKFTHWESLITSTASWVKLDTPISKPVKGKSSPFDHDDDLGYFGGMRFLGFVVIDNVMPNLQGN